MPEGERSFLQSKGPRKMFSVRVSKDTYLLLKVAGGSLGLAPSGQAAVVLERWAESFLRRHADDMRRQLAEDKERRASEASPAASRTRRGRSVQGGE